MRPDYRCCGVHFVGSIPLATAADVFAAIGADFRGEVARVPDGETGERTNWIQYQEDVFARTPGLEPVAAVEDPRNANAQRKRTVQQRVRAGATLTPESLPPLGYAESAIASYREFERAVAAGRLAPDAKYLVAVPTPFCVVHFGIAPESRAAVEPAYAERLYREVEAICAAVPHSRLSLQWDCAHDMQAFDGARDVWFEPRREGIVERIAQALERVPTTVEAGLHLCYGSFGGRHFVEPKTMQSMVELTNAVFARVRRPIGFVHMPVPIERDDDAYFAALADLRMPPEVELFLGLVHDADGAAGTIRRAETAAKYRAEFGIAAECGFGRRPSADVPRILATHRQVIEQLRAR